MIKIYDEELTQIRLRDLSGDGVAVEIVGEGDLLQITEGQIHFGGPAVNFHVNEHPRKKVPLGDHQILWDAVGISLEKHGDEYFMSTGLHHSVYLPLAELVYLSNAIIKELNP